METSLESLALIVQRRVDSRIRELGGMRGAKERLEWMNQHGLGFLEDLITLIDTHNALFRYRALRVAYIVDTHPEDQIVAETVRETAMLEHQKASSRLQPRLTELWRYFSMAIDCPGSLGATILGRGKTARQVSEKASRIRDSIGDLYERLIGTRLIEADAPPILQQSESLREVGRRIRWLLIELQDRGSVWRVSIYERRARPKSTAKLELDYRKSEFARETVDRCLRDLTGNCCEQDGR